MDIKPIKTNADYQNAMAQIESLFNAQPGTPDSDSLDVLTTLVESFERENFPIPAPDPVAAIQYFLESRKVTRKELVKILGTKSRVTEVLNYKRGLSLRMIRNLHDELGIPADVLIRDYEIFS